MSAATGLGKFSVLFSVLSFVTGAYAAPAPAPAATPQWRQLAELTDTVQAVGDWMGESVAVSGNTAVVGAPNYVQPGSAYVFVAPASGWKNMQQTAVLSPSDAVAGDDFGDAVAISGNTIVVAAQNLSAVYVFVKPANGWHNMTQTAKLTASTPQSRFGLGLAISGNTVVVGAYGTNDEGTAYVYSRPTSGWHDMQQTGELLATNKGDFGMAVAISGNTVAVGAPEALDGTGAVYVYAKPPAGWADVEPVATLTASDALTEDGGNFGGSLSMLGNTIMTGAFFAGTQRTGEAYIFVEPAHGWIDGTETARLQAPVNAQEFGMAVAIGSNMALVSAPYSLQDEGTVYVYNKPKTGWKTGAPANAKLEGKDSVAGDLFGNSVSLSGQTALVGAFQHNSIRGAAYVFQQ